MLLNAMIGLSMLGAVVSATISSKEATKKVGANQHFLSDYVTAGTDRPLIHNYASCGLVFNPKHPFFFSYEV